MSDNYIHETIQTTNNQIKFCLKYTVCFENAVFHGCLCLQWKSNMNLENAKYVYKMPQNELTATVINTYDTLCSYFIHKYVVKKWKINSWSVTASSFPVSTSICTMWYNLFRRWHMLSSLSGFYDGTQETSCTSLVSKKHFLTSDAEEIKQGSKTRFFVWRTKWRRQRGHGAVNIWRSMIGRKIYLIDRWR